MSVKGKPLPPPQTFLGVLDVEAKRTMTLARDAVDEVVQRETPHRTGNMARKLKPRVSKVGTGYSLTVGPSRGAKEGNVSLADVVRWVNRGTGIYRQGPGPKRRIRAKHPLRRMTLPGGAKRWSVAGQRSDPFMARIASTGTQRVETVAEQGAEHAARELERTVAR